MNNADTAASKEDTVYEIVVWNNGQWNADSVGSENNFETEAVALAAIPELQGLGEEWATARYGVREIGSTMVTEVQYNDGTPEKGTR